MIKKNSFDLIKALAALSILLLHFTGYAWLTLKDASPVIISDIRNVVTFFPGVVVFFSVSGFLTAASLEKSEGIREFLIKRAKRIYPGLWICMAVNIIAVCIIKGGTGWMDKSFILWIFTQGIGIANTPACLKDFATGSINGPLWTVMVQLQFYVLLALFYGKIKDRLSKKAWLFGVFPIMFVLNILSAFAAGRSELLGKLLERSFIPYIGWFAAGVFCYRFLDELCTRFKKLFWILLIIYIIYFAAVALLPEEISEVLGYGYYTSAAGSYLCAFMIPMLGMGAISILPQVRFKTDISYEVFLYHWIVLNALVYYDAYHLLGWIPTLLILLAGTLVLSIVSKILMRLFLRHEA